MSVDTPKTLLQMSGAPLEPASLAEAVLVMIDCQCEYVTGFLPLEGIGTALDVCADLLARARNAGTPIIHIAHKGKPGGAFDRDAEGGRIDDHAAPRDGEQVIEKSLPNAFAGTGLQDAVKATNRQQIILAGFMTHMCISSTARAALDIGLRTTILAPATATRNLPDGNGGVVPADTVQTASLAALADRFAIIASDIEQIV